jgi:hypothetical protein
LVHSLELQHSATQVPEQSLGVGPWQTQRKLEHCLLLPALQSSATQHSRQVPEQLAGVGAWQAQLPFLQTLPPVQTIDTPLPHWQVPPSAGQVSEVPVALHSVESQHEAMGMQLPVTGHCFWPPGHLQAPSEQAFPPVQGAPVVPHTQVPAEQVSEAPEQNRAPLHMQAPPEQWSALGPQAGLDPQRQAAPRQVSVIPAQASCVPHLQ